jgi:hypothetical protein
MALRKVVWAGVNYTKDGIALSASRGDVIDFDAEDLKRLEGKGAVTSVDDELMVPGVLLELNENASVQQVISYLDSGRIPEILAQAASYPLGLVDKILVEEERGQERADLLKGLRARLGKDPASPTLDAAQLSFDPIALVKGDVADIVAYATERPETVSALRTAELSGQKRKEVIDALDGIHTSAPLLPADTTGQGIPSTETFDPSASALDAPTVLEGNEGAVLAYAEDHPEDVATLLEAEQADKGKKRKGVIEGLTKLTEA